MLEMIIATGLLLLFMGAAYTTSAHIQELSMRTGLRIAAQQGARLAINKMARQILMTGADPSGRAFGSVDEFVVTTATTLRIRTDLPHDFNGNGTPWDVLDNNNDGDTEDDNEDENGDGYLNDVGEDVTFAFDAAKGVITYTDNTAATVVTLAANVVANPSGAPLFTYSRDPTTGVPETITITLTVSGGRNDLLTDEEVLFTAVTAVAPRMQNTPEIISSEIAPGAKKPKKKKKKKKD